MSALALAVLDLNKRWPGEAGDPMELPAGQWRRLVALAGADSGPSTSTPKPYRLAIIACSKSKGATAAPAGQLYTGELFKASRAVAERLADRYVILSAKHGVLRPETVIEPYDQSIAAMPKHQRAIWGARVEKGLRNELGYSLTHISDPRSKEVLCLAPESYVEIVEIYGKRDWSRPLRGLGIGQQKAKLKDLGVS